MKTRITAKRISLWLKQTTPIPVILIATAGVFFGLANSGQSSPTSLSDEDTCANLPLPFLKPGIDWKLGIVIIVLEEGQEEEGKALHNAALEGSTVAGIAPFDSLGKVLGLQRIGTWPDYSTIFMRGFNLYFPQEADLVMIMQMYCQFPFIKATELDWGGGVDTVTHDYSWAEVKRFIKGE